MIRAPVLLLSVVALLALGGLLFTNTASLTGGQVLDGTLRRPPRACVGPCNDNNPRTCQDAWQRVGAECKCVGKPLPYFTCGTGSCSVGVEAVCVNNVPQRPSMCDCASIVDKACMTPAGAFGKCTRACECLGEPSYAGLTTQQLCEGLYGYATDQTITLPQWLNTCLKIAQYIDWEWVYEERIQPVLGGRP